MCSRQSRYAAFFLGLNPAGFAAAPYVGLFNDQLQCSARSLGLRAAQEAECYILPQIGGFVGADTVAALLSIPMDQNNTYLLVDVGTNSEIVLKHQEEMWAASAAAGPAFEGGGITCGMRAGEGAIDRIFLGPGGKWSIMSWEMICPGVYAVQQLSICWPVYLKTL